jgi:hypothetical protein
VFKQVMFYFNSSDPTSELLEITAKGAGEIIALNKKGEIPESFNEFKVDRVVVEASFEDAMGQDNINRFDNRASKKARKRPERRENFKTNRLKATQRRKSQKENQKKDA